MKALKIIPILIFVLATFNLTAETKDEEVKLDRIETTVGKVYENVIVREIAPDGINITHSMGLARIPVEELPDQLKEQFGIKADANAEKAREERERKFAETRTKRALAEKRRELEELERSLTVPIKIRALSITDGGVLGFPSHGRITEDSHVNRMGLKIVEDTYIRWGLENDEPVFVRGVDWMTDGDSSSMWAIPDGTFEYSAVSGAKKTVRAYRLAKSPEKGD